TSPPSQSIRSMPQARERLVGRLRPMSTSTLSRNTMSRKRAGPSELPPTLTPISPSTYRLSSITTPRVGSPVSPVHLLPMDEARRNRLRWKITPLAQEKYLLWLNIVAWPSAWALLPSRDWIRQPLWSNRFSCSSTEGCSGCPEPVWYRPWAWALVE